MASGLANGSGFAQQLEALLAAFTNPDNGVRRRAEAAWEDMKLRLPDEVWHLSFVVGTSPGTTAAGAPRPSACVAWLVFGRVSAAAWLMLQLKARHHGEDIDYTSRREEEILREGEKSSSCDKSADHSIRPSSARQTAATPPTAKLRPACG